MRVCVLFPGQDTLGSRKGLLRNMDATGEDEADNGHIARNVRLSLMVVDLVEPYLRWSSPTLEMVSFDFPLCNLWLIVSCMMLVRATNCV